MKEYNELIVRKMTNKSSHIHLYIITRLHSMSNSEEMFEHIRKVYDFSTSPMPPEEWWWHLDKILRGEIILNAVPVQEEVI